VPEALADPVDLWDELPPAVPPGPEVAPAPEAPPAATGEELAWWDDEPSPGPAPADGDASVASGRFALGGFAVQPGQQALGGVTFRTELDAPPSTWAIAPAADAVPGTLVLSLDGAINCDAAGLEVATEPGFAPTGQGFTVRVEARDPGPFAASGTFRVV